MAIIPRDQFLAEQHASKKAFAEACRGIFNSLDQDAGALATYGLELKIEQDHMGLSLRHGEYELSSVAASKGSKFEYLLNDYITFGPNDYRQGKFEDGVKAAEAFGRKVPGWVKALDEKRGILEALGLI